jgi:hypothetical protein
MPVLSLVVLAVLVVAVVSYNASRATISKMELTNAADGAAFSGALQTARSMNFMAYTSRGMVANTIGAGYLVVVMGATSLWLMKTPLTSMPGCYRCAPALTALV